MATKPSDLPRWADVGGDITDPPSGKKDVGWADGEKPPHDYFNWIHNLVYQWQQFIDDPEASGTDPAFNIKSDAGDGVQLRSASATPSAAGDTLLRLDVAAAEAAWHAIRAQNAGGNSTIRLDTTGTGPDMEFVPRLSDPSAFSGGLYFNDTAQRFRHYDANLAQYINVRAGPDLTLPIRGINLVSPGVGQQMALGAGSAVDSTGTDIITLGAPILCDLSVSGAGGLDTGIPANNTWYYFYCIRNSSTGAVDSLGSLSSTAPTLPGAFDQFRRVGSGRLDNVGQMQAVVQLGAGPDRWYYWNLDRATQMRVLSGGAAIAWTSVSVATMSPPTANLVQLVLDNSVAAGSAQLLEVRTPSHASATGQTQVQALAVGFMGNVDTQLPPFGSAIEYQQSAAGALAQIDVIAYMESV